MAYNVAANGRDTGSGKRRSLKLMKLEAAMGFNVGDVVMLKSGGSRMTVESLGHESVHCVWSDGKKTLRDSFLPITLTKYMQIEDFLAALDAQEAGTKKGAGGK